MNGSKSTSNENSAESTGEKSFRIRRGKVDSLSLYEITDYELDVLARGSPTGTYANLAVFFFTLGSSFWIALATSKLGLNKTYVLFMILAILGVSGGGVFAILWYRARQPVKDLVNKIKSRIPDDQSDA